MWAAGRTAGTGARGPVFPVEMLRPTISETRVAHLDFDRHGLRVPALRGALVLNFAIDTDLLLHTPVGPRLRSVFGHLARRKSVVGALLVSGRVIVYQNVILIRKPALQNVHRILCLLQDFLVGEVSITLLAGAKDEAC